MVSILLGDKLKMAPNMESRDEHLLECWFSGPAMFTSENDRLVAPEIGTKQA